VLKLFPHKAASQQAPSNLRASHAFFTWGFNPWRVLLGVTFVGLHLLLDRAYHYAFESRNGWRIGSKDNLSEDNHAKSAWLSPFHSGITK
jgi:hypothetical protein